MAQQSDLMLVQVVECNADESWIDADEKICEFIQQNKKPENDVVAKANYFFTKLIRKLHTDCETMAEPEQKICKFLLNRLYECQRVLVIYFYKTTNRYFVPGQLLETVAPTLEERSHFPKLRDHKGPHRPSSTFMMLIGLSKRVKKFLLTVNQFLYPDDPKFVIYYKSLRSSSENIITDTASNFLSEMNEFVKDLKI